MAADYPFPGAQMNLLELGVKMHSKTSARTVKKLFAKPRGAVT